MKTTLQSRLQPQQGFSLVELMVAMALGLLLSAAAIQMFLTSQQSMNVQQGTSEV
ncbi:MAG TPA: prepilin-type N-terminal cleavage/methylation domain-containing protein, partial [Moraxellaceae bacterium]